MFQKALTIAEDFTFPVVISTRLFSGAIKSGVTAFVIVNDAGWALTAAHVLMTQAKAQADRAAIDGWRARSQAVKMDSSLPQARRQNLLKNMKSDPNWIDSHSYWWAWDNVTTGRVFVDQLADLALVELIGIPPGTVKRFPVFGNSEAHIKPGASLCRLGFPFNAMEVAWDAAKSAFEMKTRIITRFPLEGMYTRFEIREEPTTGKSARFLETSSPGARGQSGGPIFDVEGTVWAIQSHTMHVDLEFSAELTVKGQKVVENQVLNVGLGADVIEIVRFAQDNGVKIAVHP